MDQTFWKNINLPMSTFTYKGNKTTGIICNGNEKAGFTLMLCLCTNGDYLNPIIIKKGKTKRCLAKVNLPENFIGCYSNNGWINIGILKVLLEQIQTYTKNTPSVLLLDSYSVHKSPDTIKLAKEMNIKIIIIPAGTTFKFQPLDVSIHGPLKLCAKRLCKEQTIEDPNIKIDMNNSLNCLHKAVNQI